MLFRVTDLLLITDRNGVLLWVTYDRYISLGEGNEPGEGAGSLDSFLSGMLYRLEVLGLESSSDT